MLVSDHELREGGGGGGEREFFHLTRACASVVGDGEARNGSEERRQRKRKRKRGRAAADFVMPSKVLLDFMRKELEQIVL